MFQDLLDKYTATWGEVADLTEWSNVDIDELIMLCEVELRERCSVDIDNQDVIGLAEAEDLYDEYIKSEN